MFAKADKHLLLSQVDMIQRNERMIKSNLKEDSWIRRMFRKCLSHCHGKPYQDKKYTILLKQKTSDDLEIKIYDACVR